MWIPIEGYPLRGYRVERNVLGIPYAMYMEGSAVVRVRLGITMFHALKRVRK